MLPSKLDHLRPLAYDGTLGCDYDHQGTRFNFTHLLRAPQHRPGNKDARSQASTAAKEAIRVKRALPMSHEGAAVHRMPPEILGIIFEHCVDEQAPSRAVLSEPPLLLGRVCRYWRFVSESTARLWTSLSLTFLETHVDRSRDDIKVVTAVETWLHRSYPAPLSIAFTDNRIFQKDTEDVVIWLLSRIRMHAPRWKSIHLKFSSDYFLQLDVLSSCAFTSLTSFAVHIDHMGWRRSLLSLRLDLTQAARLSSLAYTGPDHVIREDILVNWAHLTSVGFSYDFHEAGGESSTLPRHFSMLTLCRNLTELSIGLSTALAQHLHQLEAMTQGQTVIPIIELPRLQTLRVRRLSRNAHACALIDALRLPQLSTLHIDSAVLLSWDMPLSHPDMQPSLLQMQAQTQWWHGHHFSALLDRSGCHLHTLCIQDVDMSPLELARLLTSPSTSSTLSAFTFEPCPRTYPISDVLAHLVSAPGPTYAATPSPSLSPDSSPPPPSAASQSAHRLHTSRPPPFPILAHLRLGCAHERHLEPIADVIASRTGECALRAGVQQPLAVFELVFYDLVYCRGHGHGPSSSSSSSRKLCFDAFRERVLRCAREGGVDVDIRVERPYEPAYLPVP